jgi:hypothetical protein
MGKENESKIRAEHCRERYVAGVNEIIMELSNTADLKPELSMAGT